MGTFWVFNRQICSNYEKKTSIFSAAHGALGPLLLLAEDDKSDLSPVSTYNISRLIVIITVFPFIFNRVYESKSIERSKVDV